MTRSRSGLIVLAVAFFSYTASGARLGFAAYDDAIFVYGGMAVARGEIPYQDFWTLYNPGQFFLIGAFFRFVIENLLAFRIFESVLVAASGMIVWDICRRLYSARTGVATACVFVLWMGAGSTLYPFHDNHTLTSLFLIVAAIDLLLVAVHGQSARRAAAAGACVGLCFVIRQDAALYLFLPQLFSFIAWGAIGDQSGKSIRTTVAGYVAGAAAPVALMLGWVLATAPGAWWRQAVVFPATQNPGLRDLPYSFTPFDFSGTGGVYQFLETFLGSARRGLFSYLPFIVSLFACILLVVYLSRSGKGPLRDLWGFAMTTLVLAASLDYSRVRSDFEHIFPTILLSFLVAPGIAVVVAATVKSRVIHRAIAVPGILIALMALLIPVFARISVQQAMAQGRHLDEGPLAGIVIDTRDPGGDFTWDQIFQAADYVAARTTPDERIFVSAPRNDRLFANYPAFYVFANRLAGTTHAELYPGVTTTDAAQRQIVSELEASDVRYFVRWPASEQPCFEPNLACHPETEGSTILDTYLQTEFESVAHFGQVEVFGR